MKNFVSIALGQSFSRSFFYKLSTSSTIGNAYAQAFLLSFFVTIENKRLVNPTLSERSRIGIARPEVPVFLRKLGASPSFAGFVPQL